MADPTAFPAATYLLLSDGLGALGNAFIGRVVSVSGDSLTVAVEELLVPPHSPVATGAVVTFPSFNGTILSAKDFGAFGDGITDDRPAISLSLFAAARFGPTSGAAVLLPPGVYMLGSPLVMPVPGGVELIGAGMDATTLRANYTTGFNGVSVVASDEFPNVRIADLTIDGNNMALSWPTTGNNGQLLDAATDWTVERVRFTNGNARKCIILDGSHNAKILNCRFEGNGPGANGHGGNDHIGGTGTDFLIEGNYYGFDPSGNSQRGNFIDLVNGSGYIIRENYVELADLGNIILEGATDSVIEGNVTYNTIVVNSDGGYPHKSVTFARNVLVANNIIDSTFRSQGMPIELRYDDNVTTGVAPSGRNAGGGNVIRGNLIYNAPFIGILLESEVANTIAGLGRMAPGGAIAEDIVSDNHIVNCNTMQEGAIPLTSGTADCAGIVVAGTNGVVVKNNTIEDNFGQGNPVSGAAFPWPSGAVLPYGLAFTTTNATPRSVRNVTCTANKVRRVTGFASGTLTVGGTPASGDQIKVVLTPPSGIAATGSYVVTPGDVSSTGGVGQIADNLAGALNNTTAVFAGDGGPFPFLQPCWVSGAVITLEALVVGPSGNAITTQTMVTGGVTCSPSGQTNLAGGVARNNDGFVNIRTTAQFGVTSTFQDNLLNNLPWPSNSVKTVSFTSALSSYTYTNLDRHTENAHVISGAGVVIRKGGVIVSSPVELRPGEQIAIVWAGVQPTIVTDLVS